MNAPLLKNLDDFDYFLPEPLIAQEPLPGRGDSRLMVLGRDEGEIALSRFCSLEDYLPKDSLLVFNNAKVTPSRLFAGCGGIRLEVLILSPPVNSARAGSYDLWCLGYPGRKLKIGKELFFEGKGHFLSARVLDINKSGQRLIRFDFGDKPSTVLDALGHLPLPPYIKRPVRSEDLDRYQTVYAAEDGAIAAPTAGLHFTKEQLSSLSEKNFKMASLHLRVGAGTFLPLTQEVLDRGTLHEEYVFVGPEAAEAILDAKAGKKPVIAVGTTTLRALEWAALDGRISAKSGFTDLFIRPGFPFRVADGLITNFHLPGSSLLMLVSAFAGTENIRRAYREAVEEKFRFFSYGDAMLIR